MAEQPRTVRLDLTVEEAQALFDWAAATLAKPGAPEIAWPVATRLHDALALEAGYVIVQRPQEVPASE